MANLPHFTTCCDATLYLYYKVMCDPEIVLTVLQRLLHYLDSDAMKMDRLTLIILPDLTNVNNLAAQSKLCRHS
jgi:hypothetical protein